MNDATDVTEARTDSLGGLTEADERALGLIRSELTDAIYEDHPCEDLAGCDIAVAVAQGVVFVAARLLTGATDAPHVHRVLDRHQRTPEGRARWEAAHREEDAWWLAYVGEHGTRCEDCGGVTYDADDARACAHCGAELAVVAERSDRRAP